MGNEKDAKLVQVDRTIAAAYSAELAVLHSSKTVMAGAWWLNACSYGGDVHLMALTFPVSITQPTSSMVMDVSATLVATTILRTSAGTFSNTFTCQHTMCVAGLLCE